MLGTVYSVMIVFSFVCATLTGNLDKMSNEFLKSLYNAVEFCIKLSGIMCFWSGFMNVLKCSGALEKLSKMLKPLLYLIYGEKIKEKDAAQNISCSIAANMLGLGNAALPFGISAVKSLEKNNKSSSASDETIMFCVLNTVPFQLIPATLVAMRQSRGSVDAFDVVPVIWLCLVLNNVFAVFLCKLLSKITRRKV